MEITRVSDYELKAVGTIEISMLMNINRVSVDSASNRGSQNPSLFSAPSLSPDGRFADEPSVSFSFSSHTANLVPRDSDNTLDVFVSDTSKMSDVNPFTVVGPLYNNIRGLPGDDTLTGTNNNDRIAGEAGNDVLLGLRGNDILHGDDGNDILNGGKGEDYLTGWYGDDILVGGAGRDIFVLGARLGMDTILDFANSEDSVFIMYGLTFDELLISPGTNGTLIRDASSGNILASLIGVPPNLIGPEDFN